MFKAGPGPVEVITGDVFKYSTLPPALGDADTVVVATGASDRMDPLGPFNVDFQVSVSELMSRFWAPVHRSELEKPTFLFKPVHREL